jgi:hypothetical protein
MFRSLFIFLLLFSTTYAAHAGWYLLARDDGCTDMQVVVRKLKLSRTPISPEDFAQMMRDRDDSVVVGLPTGVSPDFAGKLVQVQFGDGKALLFVKDEICRSAEFGKK